MKARFISFNDIKPAGSNLNQSSGGIGIDRNQNVYFAASDTKFPDDVVIFRYNTETDARELLGTVRKISEAQGNLGPNQYCPYVETIAKVHVPFLEYHDKMYFSSHDFHGSFKHLSHDIYDHRGGHFYSFDLKTGAFEDLSRTDDYGVSVRHQGIIAMNILRQHNKLVGFTYPKGDILIYDLNKRRTELYSGPAEYRNKDVTREIIATRKGKIYFSYESRKFWLWEFDIETGVMKRTEKPNKLKNGIINGMVMTGDESTVYLLDNDGNLYAFYVEKEHLEELGSLLPKEEIAKGLTITFVRSLVLSNDEKKLYTLPSMFEKNTFITNFRKKLVNWIRLISPSMKQKISLLRTIFLEQLVSFYSKDNTFGCKLYEYDIETGQKSVAAEFPYILEGTLVTGNGVIDDRGRIYYCYHSHVKNSARLIQIYE
jgi:hypothetical protein